jgi:DNA polymerase-3 subunit alpha
MVFQEQVMQTAQTMAGFSMVEADALRKAMGKKIPAVMKEQEEKFVAGCIERGHPEALGRELFGFIKHFAGYGFNKSHSAAYALIAYQTAWLKVHYPAEYMAALLTAVKRDKDKTAIYLHECRIMGIPVHVPDVNVSESDFVGVDGAISFGLSAIRNVGEAVVAKIVEERSTGGLFEDFGDFVDRVDVSVLNKRTVESLIKAGAFDSLGHSRLGLLEVAHDTLDATIARRRAEDMGQYSLFGGADDEARSEGLAIPDVEWGKKAKLAFEKEMLGLYVSDHPLLGVEKALEAMCSTSMPGMWEMVDKTTATIGGVVGSINTRYTKTGDPMYFFNFEDLQGSVEVVCFPRTVAEFGPMIREDAVLVITGRVDHRGDDVKMIAQQVREPRLEAEAMVRLRVPATRMSRSTVEQLRGVLANHPGDAGVFLHMTADSGERVIELGSEHRVEPRSALFAELRELLGPSVVM